MVKVKAFQGYTYAAEDYSTLFNFNHEGLSPLSEFKKTYLHRVSTQVQIKTGMLNEDSEEHFYIYRQIFEDKEMIGLMSEASIEDYEEGKIKVHEKTLCRPGYDHNSFIKDHVGPVVLSFANQGINIKDILLQTMKKHETFCKWKTVDGRHHTLWKVGDDEGIVGIFRQLKCFYVLDGHHRLQAARDNYLHSKNKQSKDSWFQALIYPPDQVSIHSFHRILHHLQPQHNVLRYLQEHKITVVPIKNLNQTHFEQFQAIYKNQEGSFGIVFKSTAREGVESLSVYKLNSEILSGIFGNNLDKHLQFLPGITNWAETIKRNNIFLMRPLKIEEIFDVAECGQIMPPKSTWFEPKPCNRMVVRIPY